MRTRGILKGGLALVLLMAVGGPVGRSQQAANPLRPDPVNPSRGLGDPGHDNDPFAGKLAEQQARGRNIDRQKKLVADTDKLLSLATELKQQVDKSNKDTLSIDVVKKADEIEKLAHSVKEKMRGGA